jgi:hypothetical protein
MNKDTLAINIVQHNSEPDSTAEGGLNMSTRIDDFLNNCTPAVRDLALQLRGLIRRVIPNAHEEVDLPSNFIGYSRDRTYTGLICAIALSKGHVSLLFPHGAVLPDPKHLLASEGQGAGRVKITTPADIENPAVQALLTSAAAAGT